MTSDSEPVKWPRFKALEKRLEAWLSNWPLVASAIRQFGNNWAITMVLILILIILWKMIVIMGRMSSLH